MQWVQMSPASQAICGTPRTIKRVGVRRYDDLANYSNDRSLYLAQLRDRIEGAWQEWESSHVDLARYQAMSPSEVRWVP